MKWFKKYWYAVAVLFVPVTATAIYFLWQWYERKKFIQPDTSNEPQTTDDMNALDYRGRTDLDFGLQNNNPGNIRTTADNWQGKVGDNNGFVVFNELRYGIRAAVKNIVSLINAYGSIQSYITAYAPPSDNNDTQAYINKICSATGLKPSDTPPLNHDMLKTIVIAHFEQENGSSMADMNIPDSEIEAGLSLTPYGA